MLSRFLGISGSLSLKMHSSSLNWLYFSCTFDLVVSHVVISKTSLRFANEILNGPTDMYT